MIYVLAGLLVCIAILRWDLSNQLATLLSLQVAIDDMRKSLKDVKATLEDTRARLESLTNARPLSGHAQSPRTKRSRGLSLTAPER